MVGEARKLAKRLNARLRKNKKRVKSLELFGLGTIFNHIKTNWVETKENVKLTSFVRNRPEGFQSH